MNFKTIASIKNQKDENGHPRKADMFGVIKTMEAADQYGNIKCDVVDDAGNKRGVQFTGNTLPQANMLGRRVQILAWATTYISKQSGKECISYKAWLQNANVPQTPQNPPQQAPQPQQAKNAPKTVQTDDRNYSFALSYAKDMVCANSLKWIDFWPTVEAFQRYLETGKTPMVKDDEQSSEEDLPANIGEEPKQTLVDESGDEIPF